MAKILVTDGMDQNAALELKNLGHEVIEKHYEIDELNQKIKEVDAIIIRSATKLRKETIDFAKQTGQLKLMVRAGVGMDNIDVDYAKAQGIAVRNTPSASSSAVAELAIGHMFALARNIYCSNVTMRNGEWNKKAYKGVELNGKTLGLIGFGRIAQSTAEKARALGMNVIYYTRSGEKEGFNQCKYREKEDLLRESDFISLHIPFVKENGITLGEKDFEMMKDGVYLVNCARGGVVDEQALLRALDTGKVAAAAIDVFEKEPTHNMDLVKHQCVSVTPHIGASTKEAQGRIGEEIVSIVKEYF